MLSRLVFIVVHPLLSAFSIFLEQCADTINANRIDLFGGGMSVECQEPFVYSSVVFQCACKKKRKKKKGKKESKL